MSDKRVTQIWYTANPLAAPVAGEYMSAFKADLNGALWIRPIATLGGGFGIQTSRHPTADGVDPATVVAFDVAAFNYIWDPVAGRWDREQRYASADNMPDIEARTVLSFLMGYDGANWDRLRIGAGNADAVAAETLGLLKTLARLTGYNGATYDRIRSGATNADGQAALGLGALETLGRLFGFNGLTWDRIRSITDTTDAQGVLTTGLLAIMSKLQGYNGATFDRLRSAGNASDTVTALAQGILDVNNFPLLWNGVAFDRERANFEVSLLSSAARTSTTNSSDQTNHSNRGVHVIIDVTSITDTPSVVPHIQAKDPVSGVYYDLLVGAAITATGTTVLKIYPGINPVAAGAASDMLPRTWRVRMIHADADSITYSVGAALDR